MLTYFHTTTRSGALGCVHAGLVLASVRGEYHAPSVSYAKYSGTHDSSARVGQASFLEHAADTEFTPVSFGLKTERRCHAFPLHQTYDVINSVFLSGTGKCKNFEIFKRPAPHMEHSSPKFLRAKVPRHGLPSQQIATQFLKRRPRVRGCWLASTSCPATELSRKKPYLNPCMRGAAGNTSHNFDGS